MAPLNVEAMKPSANNERVFAMSFASVYPHYVNKVVGKGRTKEELHTVIHWLTGYDEQALYKVIADKTILRFSALKFPEKPGNGAVTEQ